MKVLSRNTKTESSQIQEYQRYILFLNVTFRKYVIAIFIFKTHNVIIL